MSPTLRCYLAVLLTTCLSSDAFTIHPSSATSTQKSGQQRALIHVVATRAPTALCSATGTLYSANDDDAPMVWLFTQEGCSKTAKVVEMLTALKSEYPHDLEAVDICDEDNRATWFSMYKDDLPILHMDDDYWSKNGDVTEEEARQAFEEFNAGTFKAREGEPDAEGGDGMEAASHVKMV